MMHALHFATPNLECARCRRGEPATRTELTEALAMALYGLPKEVKPSLAALRQWFEVNNAFKAADRDATPA